MYIIYKEYAKVELEPTVHEQPPVCVYRLITGGKSKRLQLFPHFADAATPRNFLNVVNSLDASIYTYTYECSRSA